MSFHRFHHRTQSRRFALGACLAVGTALLTTLITRDLHAAQDIGSQADPSDILAIDVQLDKHEALVAERIELEITATAPQGVTVKFPASQAQLGDFEVFSAKDTLDIPAGSNRKWIRRLGLESLVSGDLEIPSIEISYVDRRGSSPTAGLQTTPVQQVKIGSTLEGVEDPTQFRDIKSVVFAPEPQQGTGRWMIWAGGATGILILAALAFVIVRRKSTFSPRNWAIKSLSDLRESQACRDNDAEQVYVRLVDILRSFVDWQFGITAPRLTTNEFLGAIRADDRLSAEFRSELQELLKLADMIKFAGMLPDGNGLPAVVEQAIRMVENTSDAQPQPVTANNSQIDTEMRASKLPSIESRFNAEEN